MSNVKPLPAGHYRYEYARMSADELRIALTRIPDVFNRSTADAVDAMLIENEIVRKEHLQAS